MGHAWQDTVQIFAQNAKETKLLFKSKLTTSANSSTGMEVSFDDVGTDNNNNNKKGLYIFNDVDVASSAE